MFLFITKMMSAELTVSQKRDTVLKLVHASSPVSNFFVVMLSATVITTMGLMMGNATIILCGVLISPALAPALSVGMGISMLDRRMVVRSVVFLFIISIFIFLVAVFAAMLMPFNSVNIEILTRRVPSSAYFVVSVFAGLAMSYAYIKPKMSAILPGIAVSFVTLPPLVVSALGVRMSDGDIMLGALLMYAVDILGVVLASVAVFVIMGFYPIKKW